ncbi:MAG: hypothetical protein Q8Q14_03425 [Gemmatimonadales bacterium]|nr:hypothetical protein [Gemmatimonadales bacterium]
MTRARTAPGPRRNPDRGALMRDAALATSETDLWRERFEMAREAGVEDLQVELIEGLRDFAQQFLELLRGRADATPTASAAITEWLMTAPATFRLDGPLARSDRRAAAAEATRAYDRMLATLFPRGMPARVRAPAFTRAVTEFWNRVLRWTAERLDRGVEEIAKILWKFEPFYWSLTRRQRTRGPVLLHDELVTLILQSFHAGGGLEARS